MGYARLRGGDGRDLAGIQMNAMSKHGARSQKTALFVDVGVIARTHVEMMHPFELFAVFGQMSLQISLKSRRQFRRAAHHFFRTSNRETRTESVFEQTVFGAVPFPAEPFAFHK